MAQIVLGFGTSHTPMLTLPADLWPAYAERDRRNLELAFPPDGLVMTYEEALGAVAPDVRARHRGTEPYRAQAAACQRALDELSATLRAVSPDVTIVIGDDQDEWFYEDNMPAFSIYWGDTAPLVPRRPPVGHETTSSPRRSSGLRRRAARRAGAEPLRPLPGRAPDRARFRRGAHDACEAAVRRACRAALTDDAWRDPRPRRTTRRRARQTRHPGLGPQAQSKAGNASGERCRGHGSVREKIVAEVLVLVCFAHQAAILQSRN